MKQVVVCDGLEFQVKPSYWLRRLTRIPLYFDNTNPSFSIVVKRLETPRSPIWPDSSQVEFQIWWAANRSIDKESYILPQLHVGDTTKWQLRDVHTTIPGQVVIRLNVPDGGLVYELYSYNVRPADHIWIGIVGPVFGFALAKIIDFFIALIRQG